MAVITWWAPIAWVLASGVVVALVMLQTKHRQARSRDRLPVAHAERLTALPAYRRALAGYRALVAAFVACLVILVALSAVLTARPATVTLSTPELHNRDIVLCLDVSGSMISYDSAVLDVFDSLSTEFTGERISLVIFNASAVTYFPLTNDYDYISQQLERLGKDFQAADPSYFDGTLLGNGSSLVGDGLAACATRFDRQQDERSRSVILVTDNLVAGEQIFTLPQAAALAADRGVRVYGINPGDTTAKDYLREYSIEFEKSITDSGGAYYPLDDPAIVPSVVASIEAEQAAVLPGAPLVTRTEHPEIFILVAFGALAGLLLLAWRLKR
ncbi:MAG: VWA domain-containing protein [Salinibacterium sp.]|nr:VWA domain-containing protein [Salinibacterium sp.]